MKRNLLAVACRLLFLVATLPTLAVAESSETDLQRLTAAIAQMDVLLATAPAEMIEPGEQALAWLDTSQNPQTRRLELQILNRLAFAYTYTKDLETARLYGGRANVLAEVVEQSQERAFAALNRGSLLVIERDMAGARVQLEEALRLYRRADGPSPGMAITLINLGGIARQEKDYVSWIEYLLTSHRVAQAAEASFIFFRVLSHLSMLHLDLGQPQRALDYAEEGIALAVSQGATRQQVFLLAEACRAHLALGAFDLAEAACSRSLELVEGTSNPFDELVGHGQLAEVLIMRGSLERAQEHVDHLFGILQRFRTRGVEAQSLLLLGRLQRRQQRPEATETLEQALTASRQWQEPETERDSLKELAELYAEAGHHRQAYEAQSGYQQLFEEMEQERHSLAAAELRVRLQTDLQDQRIKGLEQERSLVAVKLESLAASRRAVALGLGLGMLLIVLVHARFRLHVARQRLRRASSHQEELQVQVRERTAELKAERDTVRLQAEKLQALDRAKSELFANVSHELRTPLTLVLGPVKDLRAGVWGLLSTEVDGQLSLVQSNAERLLDLVGQALDVARLESGSMAIRPALGELRGFLQKIMQSLVPLAERHGIELYFQEAEQGPEQNMEAYFDSEMLEKVFTNLITNALKFNTEGGVVSVSLMVDAADHNDSQEETPISVIVQDDGPGIPAEEQERIFDRFYQVKHSDQGRWPGSGLGLSLARDLVELHGGRIEVESEVGVGTTFVVKLRHGRHHFLDPQMATSSVLAEMDLMGTGSAATGSTPTISVSSEAEQQDPELEEDCTTVLVVDDNVEVRAYLRRHLAGFYRVVEAADGTQGFDRARESLPDLVISDVMMPGVDGTELCRRLKADKELAYVPVILLTARADGADRLEGLQAGADDYLAKPFEVDELLARVDNLIASRRRFLQRPVDPESAPVEIPALEMSSNPSRDQALVNRVWQVIGEHLEEEDFNVDSLADHLSMDRSHLYRRLQTLVGESPSDLIRQRRLQQAETLLRQGSGSVSEIAYQVGFRSVSHFSRSFRHSFGRAPSALLNEIEPPPLSLPSESSAISGPAG